MFTWHPCLAVYNRYHNYEEVNSPRANQLLDYNRKVLFCQITFTIFLNFMLYFDHAAFSSYNIAAGWLKTKITVEFMKILDCAEGIDFSKREFKAKRLRSINCCQYLLKRGRNSEDEEAGSSQY